MAKRLIRRHTGDINCSRALRSFSPSVLPSRVMLTPAPYPLQPIRGTSRGLYGRKALCRPNFAYVASGVIND